MQAPYACQTVLLLQADANSGPAAFVVAELPHENTCQCMISSALLSVPVDRHACHPFSRTEAGNTAVLMCHVY